MALQLKNKLVLLILLLFSLITIAQDNNSLQSNSELVFFEDNNLVKLLENIITTENSCSKGKKTTNWYLDFRESNSVIVSQGRIVNLIELADIQEKKIFTTIINNKIVFILANNKENLFSKTGFSIDLRDYLNKSIIVFEDFSSWLINTERDSYKIVNSTIWKCK